MSIYDKPIQAMQKCIDTGMIYERRMTPEEIASFRRAIEVLREAERIEAMERAGLREVTGS
jgi:hypothetical protein